MQFFPPVHSAMMPEVRAKGLFAGSEAMNAEAFDGLLSAHLASRESGHNAPQTASNGAGATVVVQETSIPSNGSGPDNGVAVRADDDEHVRDARREHARPDAEDLRSGPAKHAGDEESPTGLIRTSGTHDIDTSVAEQGGGIAVELEELTVAAQALIHESESAKTQEGKAAGAFEHVGSRLQAIRDLLTLFRQSEPSERSALAATLGSHIRELRAALPEVASSRKARGADSVNGQPHPFSSKSDQNPARDGAGTPVSRIGSLIRRMEELGTRLVQVLSVPGQGGVEISVQARDSVSSGKDAFRIDPGRPLSMTGVPGHGLMPPVESGDKPMARSGSRAGGNSGARSSAPDAEQNRRDAARQSLARDVASSGKSVSRADAGRSFFSTRVSGCDGNMSPIQSGDVLETRSGLSASGDSAARSLDPDAAQGVRDVVRQGRVERTVIPEERVALRNPGQDQQRLTSVKKSASQGADQLVATAVNATNQTAQSRGASFAGQNIPVANARSIFGRNPKQNFHYDGQSSLSTSGVAGSDGNMPSVQRSDTAVGRSRLRVAGDSAALASPTGPAHGVRDAARQSRVQGAVVTEGRVALQSPGQEQHGPASLEQPAAQAAERQAATVTKATNQTMRSRVASSAGPDIPAAEVRPLLRQNAGPTLLGGAEAEQMAVGQTESQDSRPVGAIAVGNRQQSRPDFFAAPERDRGGSPRTVAAGTAKADFEGVAGTLTSTSSTPAPLASRLDGPLNARSEQVFRQVETSAFRNLGQGVRQLVIRLEPADLGQVSVILQVRGKEVQAVLRASSQDTSQVLSEQLGQLRTQLEAQGLRVSRLEVQTQLADSQTQAQWQGAEQHNRYQENRELALTAQRWRTLGRAETDLVQDVQSVPQRENISPHGLDIFA